MILWKPTGKLNVSTDPCDLPEETQGNNIISGSMVRCKNLRLDQMGVAKLRDGSSKINTTALSETEISYIIELNGNRYTFTRHDEYWAVTHDWEDSTDYFSDDGYQFTHYDSGTTTDYIFDWESNYLNDTTETVNDQIIRGGWTSIIYKNETRIGESYTSGQWSAFIYSPYNSTTQSIYALNGFDRIRIEDESVYDWGIENPPAKPFTEYLTTGGSIPGLEVGTYYYKYTYCRKEGPTVVEESNPSTSSDAVTIPDENKYGVIYFPTPSDPQITHYRLYRTLNNGSTFYHVLDIGVAATYYLDNNEDSELGSEVSTDNNRPPMGSFAGGPNYDGYCFIIKDNRLYFCKAKRPDNWPVSYYIEVSLPQFPGKSIVLFNGQPYYMAQNEIYMIQGTGYTSFFPFPMKALTGTQSIFGACSVANHGIFHIASDGVYLFSGISGGDRKISQAEFEPIFRGEDTNGIPGMSDATNSWIFQFGNKLYVGYMSTGYTYPTNCIRLDLDTLRPSYYTWNREIRIITSDEYNKRILAADNSGFIWILEDKTVTEDNGTAIDWEMQSKDFTLQTRAHFPRWIKYDVDASGASSATGQIILDGDAHQNHTLTTDRTTRKRLVETGNGERAAINISGSGPIEIYAAEFE